MNEITTQSNQLGNQSKISPSVQAMIYAMNLIGFNPENIEKSSLDTIITYIKNNYKGLSLKEFKEAFDLAVAGKLDFNYHSSKNFNTLYVSNVLQSYKRYQQSENRKNKLHKPEERVKSTFEEKKSHFEWLLNDIYLDDSKRNKKRGEFPDILICNWKDVYDYMLSEGMIIEKQGIALTKRLEEVKNLVMLEDKSKTKSLISSVKIKINGGNKPMSYYRFEVMDWFKANKEQLTF